MTRSIPKEYTYCILSKGRSKQNKKGGGIAVLITKASSVSSEWLSVGECDMSKDLMAVKLEFMGEGRKECLYVCVCYMTVEGQQSKVENKRKYDIMKNFARQHVNNRVSFGGYEWAYRSIGRKNECEWINAKEVCDAVSMAILSETIAEGKVTWCKRKQQSPVDFTFNKR